jgi:hypothetical protein
MPLLHAMRTPYCAVHHLCLASKACIYPANSSIMCFHSCPLDASKAGPFCSSFPVIFLTRDEQDACFVFSVQRSRFSMHIICVARFVVWRSTNASMQTFALSCHYAVRARQDFGTCWLSIVRASLLVCYVTYPRCSRTYHVKWIFSISAHTHIQVVMDAWHSALASYDMFWWSVTRKHDLNSPALPIQTPHVAQTPFMHPNPPTKSSRRQLLSLFTLCSYWCILSSPSSPARIWLWPFNIRSAFWHLSL